MKTKTRKTMLSILIVLQIIPTLSHAWSETPVQEKEYTFHYQYNGQKYSIQKKSNSYEEAYEFAAQKCFQTLQKNEKSFNREKGLDMIDICANPRHQAS